MSKANNIAFHGSSVGYETLQQLGGILPRVAWQRPAISSQVAQLPLNLQRQIYSYVGPVLRRGPGDADPNLSVSLTWSAKVSCFFPPKKTFIYLYVIDTTALQYSDVDKFASLLGLNRSYMKEIALSFVPIHKIMGYCIVLRRPPPPDIESIVVHRMEALPGPYFERFSNNQAGYQEILAATDNGAFTISDSIVGTFRTTDSLGLNRRTKDPNLDNPYI